MPSFLPPTVPLSWFPLDGARRSSEASAPVPLRSSARRSSWRTMSSGRASTCRVALRLVVLDKIPLPPQHRWVGPSCPLRGARDQAKWATVFHAGLGPLGRETSSRDSPVMIRSSASGVVAILDRRAWQKGYAGHSSRVFAPRGGYDADEVAIVWRGSPRAAPEPSGSALAA